MALKDDLMQLGLTKTEASIYMALLEYGPCSLAQLTKHAHIHRTNTYAALESLNERGMCAMVKHNDKKLYQAADPVILKAMIEDKLALVNRILPQLALSQSLTHHQADVMLYEGTDAIRAILAEMLDIDDERVVFGVSKIASELMGDFFDEYHQRRIRKGKKLRHIYNYDVKERRSELNILPLTECRYLPPEYDSPVATSVCGDIVMMTFWQKKPISIVIRNKEVAAAYKRYFEILWQRAKK